MSWLGADMFPLCDLTTTSLAGAAAMLRQAGIIVASARLDALPDGLAQSLAPEREAAQRLPPEVAAGFIARRRIARSLLADALGEKPERFALTQSELGAPRIEGPAAAQGFALSFSARGPVALIGLMRIEPGRGQLGVDIEEIAPDFRIPWNILHADERHWLEACGGAEQMERMIWLWTIKEATVKALGQGFRIPPEDVGVALPPNGARDAPHHERPRLFLRNPAMNAALEGALVLTWPDVPVLKGGVSGAKPGGEGYRRAAAVILAATEKKVG